MKIVQFETDFMDYHKLLRTQTEEIIPVPSLKKDDTFKGVKIMSEGKKHGKFILYKAEYVDQ